MPFRLYACLSLLIRYIGNVSPLRSILSLWVPDPTSPMGESLNGSERGSERATARMDALPVSVPDRHARGSESVSNSLRGLAGRWVWVRGLTPHRGSERVGILAEHPRSLVKMFVGFITNQNFPLTFGRQSEPALFFENGHLVHVGYSQNITIYYLIVGFFRIFHDIYDKVRNITICSSLYHQIPLYPDIGGHGRQSRQTGQPYTEPSRSSQKA